MINYPRYSLCALLIIIVTILFCGELPIDPILNPNNATIQLQSNDITNTMIYEGDTKEITLELNLLKHFNEITISSLCGNVDTSFTADTTRQNAVINFTVTFSDAGQCGIIATASMLNPTLASKSDTLTVAVFPKPSTLLVPSHIDAPSEIVAGKPDTLRFAVDNSAGANPMTILLYTETPLDESVFSVLPSSPDSIIIAVAPTAASGTASANIGIITSNSTTADTSWYPIAIIADTSTVTPPPVNTEAPHITQIAGTGDNTRVTEATGTMTFTITDSNGVGSVTWSLNNVASGPVFKQADGTYLLSYTLTSFGENSISITAEDASTQKNQNTLPVTVLYNLVPSPGINSVPADNETAVATSTTFTWTGGNDIDGDTVYSKVLFGTEESALTQTTGEVTTNTAALSTPLSINTSYYWQVLSYTKTPVTDTVRSEITSFTTAGKGVEITRQPVAPADLYNGDAITLSVAAEGIPAPTYQWYKNDTLLPAETEDTLTKDNISPADNGVYHVIVSNGVGVDVTSLPVTISVKVKADITEQPKAKSTEEGGSVTFTVSANGDEPLTYLWLKDGQPIPNQTTSACTLTSLTPDDNGAKISCIVSNTFSSDTSTGATLSVSATPVYTVTFNTDGGSDIDQQDIKEGETADKPNPDPTKQGHEFEGWYLSGTKFNFTTPITAPITIIAQWAKICTLSYNDNYADVHQAPGVQTCKEGDTLKVAYPPAAMTKYNHECIGWCVNWNCNTTYSGGEQITMSDNITLSANWKQTKCTITLNANGGIVNPQTMDVNIGSNASVLPQPSRSGGYAFTGWYTSMSGGAKVSSLDSNQTVWAHWDAIDCSARGDEVYICSGDGKTYHLPVYSNNSACSIIKYQWCVVSYAYIPLPDPEFDGLFVSSGHTSNILTVSNVKGGAYGFVCIVTFEGGAKDTVGTWSPDPSCNP